MKLTNLDEIKNILTENSIPFSCKYFIPAYEYIPIPSVVIPWNGSQRVINLLNETGIYFGSEKQHNQRVIY